MALLEAAKTGLGAVQSGRSYIDTLANKYIVKPKNSKGIGGFVFDYEGETQVVLQAEITDHYAEDNSAINDHIAIRPTRIVLRGFIGELVSLKPAGLAGALNLLQDKLSTVPAYLGKYTPSALAKIQGVLTQGQNVVNKVDQTLARVSNVVGFFGKASPGLNNQQKAYNKLNALMFAKQVFIVQTPYGTHNNMVVESIAYSQDEETKSWSDICVALKQMRFVDVKVSSSNNFSLRAAAQRAPQVDKGKTAGTEKPVSILRGLVGK